LIKVRIASKDGELNVSEPLYVLGRTAEETERLQTQAAFLQPLPNACFVTPALGSV
jgi:hypothetical protein